MSLVPVTVMAIGDVRAVTTGDCTDLYLVDTGMYDTDSYGAVYLLDAERPAIVETGIGTHHDRILDALSELDIERAEIDVIAVTHLHPRPGEGHDGAQSPAGSAARKVGKVLHGMRRGRRREDSRRLAPRSRRAWQRRAATL